MALQFSAAPPVALCCDPPVPAAAWSWRTAYVPATIDVASAFCTRQLFASLAGGALEPPPPPLLARCGVTDHGLVFAEHERVAMRALESFKPAPVQAYPVPRGIAPLQLLPRSVGPYRIL